MGEVGVQFGPGEQIPGTVYRVVRHIATGGMGSVYDVEDVSVGKRYVLKTLHPKLVARRDLAKRMAAEARTLAKLQHPNIVDVVTAGLTSDSKRTPYYVMERLNGQTLGAVIDKRGALEMTHCFRIAIDVLDALGHAHDNAIIHRDVKPDNIFLHRTINGIANTKLLDFGIMRLLDRKASHTHGQFIGTLRYASPEQIFGGELGPATDIYSLGIVLYEMITGRGPFDEITDTYAIGVAHAQSLPPPVSSFTPSVSPQLERLVMSALAKEAAGRPRDCFSFARDLRRMLREEEATAKSDTIVNMLTLSPPSISADGSPFAARASEANSVGEASAEAAAAPFAAAAAPAPEYARVGAGFTRRIPLNGAVHGGGAALLPHVVRPDSGVSSAVRPHERLEEKPRFTSTTGPTSGESRTRPDERSVLLPVFAAVVVAVLIAGAGMYSLRHREPVAQKLPALSSVASVGSAEPLAPLVPAAAVVAVPTRLDAPSALPSRASTRADLSPAPADSSAISTRPAEGVPALTTVRRGVPSTPRVSPRPEDIPFE